LHRAWEGFVEQSKTWIAIGRKSGVASMGGSLSTINIDGGGAYVIYPLVLKIKQVKKKRQKLVRHSFTARRKALHKGGDLRMKIRKGEPGYLRADEDPLRRRGIQGTVDPRGTASGLRAEGVRICSLAVFKKHGKGRLAVE